MSTHHLQGPDVLVIGWIPFFSRFSAIPSGHNYPNSLATRALFSSGNPDPQPHFLGFNDFRNWLSQTKEYRAALYLRDVKLSYADGDPAPKIGLEGMNHIGYTPIRLIVRGRNLVPRQLRKYKQGLRFGPRRPIAFALPNNEGVHINHKVQFKISGLMAIFARVLTGSWPPTCWIEIDYRIYRNGSVEIDFQGSAIPTKGFYLDWTIVDRRDMLSNTAAEIHDFDNSPGCSKAVGAYKSSWAGHATVF